jgi:hypothetical protein
MADRTTETQITFKRAFSISQLSAPLAAGTYRITTEEDEIAGLSFVAYQRTATMLHIPALGTFSNTSQYIEVSPKELEAAQLKDAFSTATGSATADT